MGERGLKKETGARRDGLTFLLPTEEVFDDPANENLHDEAQLIELAESLRTFGQQRALVVSLVSGRYVCTAGHGILLAARRLGLPEVRCKLSSLRGHLRAGYRLFDNLVRRLALVDDALAAEAVARVAAARPDIGPAAMGYSPDEWALALDRSRVGGRSIDPALVEPYSPDSETFVVKVAGVAAAEAEGLLARVNRELEGTAYAATLS